MFVWVGCAVPEAVAAPLRAHCLACNEKLGLSAVAFSLPQHISLKISFSVPDPEPVLDFLEDVLSQESRFTAAFADIARLNNILWCGVQENHRLRQLHQKLDSLLQAHWGIVPHPFDLDFRFHSTLFMDPDQEKLEQMRTMLHNYPLSPSFPVTTCLLGVSPSGVPGSFQVVREINFL